MVLRWSSPVKSSQKAARFVRLQEAKARRVCGLIERFFLTPHPAQYAPPSPTFKFCGVILTLSKGEGFLFCFGLVFVLFRLLPAYARKIHLPQPGRLIYSCISQSGRLNKKAFGGKNPSPKAFRFYLFICFSNYYNATSPSEHFITVTCVFLSHNESLLTDFHCSLVPLNLTLAKLLQS